MGTLWDNQENRDRGASTKQASTEAELAHRAAARGAAVGWLLWTLCALFSVAGVVLGLDHHQDQGRALQLAGLTLAVVSWAYQERHGRRHG